MQDKSERYLKYAKAAEREALRAGVSDEREAFLKIAATWKQLAEAKRGELEAPSATSFSQPNPTTNDRSATPARPPRSATSRT